MIIQENTIIHGDSLTVLRQMEPESVDAIITDPPYGINYVSQTGASIKNDKSPFIWFLYDAFRVLKSGEAGHGGLICFTRWDVEQTFIDAMKIAGFNVKSEVIWDNGQHQLRIEAVDGNFATSVRVFSFSKKETVIKFELAAPEETDAAATKVLVTPTWKIEGAVAKVEACNNGFDAVPTWEDITAMVQINRVYNFTNKTKTASKWGVNIRFTITKNEGFEGEVSISGFGGAYE